MTWQGSVDPETIAVSHQLCHVRVAKLVEETAIFMSVEALSRAWDNSIHKGSELLVLVAIAENSNDDTDSTYLSIEFLCWKTRLSRRSVQRIVRTLEESGELLIMRNRGRNGTNVYRINTKPGNYELRPSTRNVRFDAFDEEPANTETELGGAKMTPMSSEVLDAPDSVVETPDSVVEHTPNDAHTVVVPLLEPFKNRRESEDKELLEIEDVVKAHPDWPSWYVVAYTVPGWTIELEKADGWRNFAKVTADLAERTAYALRDWWPTSSDKRQKKGDPYKTWQNWCRRDRDVAPSGARGVQRQPVRTGSDFKGYE